jgi:hypothetical protein
MQFMFGKRNSATATIEFCKTALSATILAIRRQRGRLYEYLHTNSMDTRVLIGGFLAEASVFVIVIPIFMILRPARPNLRRTIGITGDVFPDGRRVLTASTMAAQVWEADTGKPIGPPLQHKGGVNSAAFSSDGLRVVTAGGDTTQVWEADTGKPLGSPLQHEDYVNSATFSSDGRRVLTASSDRTAQVREVLLDCCDSPMMADRLASLAEAVGGYEASDTGNLSALGVDERQERLRKLGRLSGTGPVPDLSVESIIRHFTPIK